MAYPLQARVVLLVAVSVPVVEEPLNLNVWDAGSHLRHVNWEGKEVGGHSGKPAADEGGPHGQSLLVKQKGNKSLKLQ